MTGVSLHCYQTESVLVRNLCKLWFLNEGKSNDTKSLDGDELEVFVKEEIAESLSERKFLSVALFFFEHTRKGVGSSLAIPTKRFMGFLEKSR